MSTRADFAGGQGGPSNTSPTIEEQNPKFEIRNKFKAENSKSGNRHFEFSSSDF
jgi:hypothetical protein